MRASYLVAVLGKLPNPETPMTNFFRYDASGQKRGPFNEQQLQALAAHGKILPTTPLETDTGYKGTAGQIPGLQFNTAVLPVDQTIPILSASVNSDTEGTTLEIPKNRMVTAFLALLLGVFGGHWFYLGRYDKGFQYLFVSIITLIFGLIGYWMFDNVFSATTDQVTGTTFGFLFSLFMGIGGGTLLGGALLLCGSVVIGAFVDACKFLMMPDEKFCEQRGGNGSGMEILMEILSKDKGDG